MEFDGAVQSVPGYPHLLCHTFKPMEMALPFIRTGKSINDAAERLDEHGPSIGGLQILHTEVLRRFYEAAKGDGLICVFCEKRP
jgi:hypothetical protein